MLQKVTEGDIFFWKKCPQNGMEEQGDMQCIWCEEELQKGEDVYDLPQGNLLCRECLYEWAEQFRSCYEGEEQDEGF